MPGESSTSNAEPDVSGSDTPGAGRPPIASRVEKAAATRRRRKDEQRVDRLAQFRAQVADGTLVVRQMTVAQHETALHEAQHAADRHVMRRKRSSALR